MIKGKFISICRLSADGSSLVSVLMVIVLMVVMVVAFAESMRIERKTSRVYANHERARLAVEAGGNAALALVALAVGEQGAYLVGKAQDEKGYSVLVIGGENLWDGKQMIPLISGDFEKITKGAEGNFEQYLNARWVEGSSNAAVDRGMEEAAGIDGSEWLQVPWVGLTNQNGETHLRYAFYLVDENECWNPKFHGEKDKKSSRCQEGEWFAGPGALPFPEEGNGSFSEAQVEAMRRLAEGVFGRHSYREVFSEEDGKEKGRLLSLDDTPFPEVIPAGLEDAGKPKYDLNDLATNGIHGATATLRAENIARVIDRNFPKFRERDASLAGRSDAERLRYVHRLAASIVDFIDEDSSPTVVNGGEPAGRDLFPMVVGMAERFQRTALTATSTTIATQVFAQVWNPYTTTIPGGKQGKMVVKNRMRVSFGAGIVMPFADYVQEASLPEVRPNEFVVVEFPTVSQTWTTPVVPTAPTPKIVASSPMESGDQTTHPYFEFYLDGDLVDMNRRFPIGPGEASAGLVRNQKTFSTGGNSWQCSFLPSQTGGGGWRTVGDPRGQFLSNYEWATISSDTSYRNDTRWKGRQANTQPRWQDFVTQWAKRDFVRLNGAEGKAPGGIGVTPSQVASVYAATDAVGAPATIKNRVLSSMGELGNIFDPAQVDDSGKAPQGGVPASPFVSGGGRTLCIGQPELGFDGGESSWDVDGKRAIGLLDLFTVNRTNAASPIYPSAVGKININTASEEVLASMFAGIGVLSDRSQSVDAVITWESARMLAQELMGGRPYEKLSDLHRFVKHLGDGQCYLPVLPEINDGGGLALMDRAREEAFGKMIEHATVQSRAFRVYVIGQVLDQKGKEEARAAAEMVVSIFTDAEGKPRPEIRYQRWEE